MSKKSYWTSKLKAAAEKLYALELDHNHAVESFKSYQCLETKQNEEKTRAALNIVEAQLQYCAAKLVLLKFE